MVLSERILHDGQKKLFCNDKISGLTNCLREVCMSVDICRGSISRFSSETDEHRQLLQETVVVCVFEIKLLIANETPLTSSETYCSISAISWELRSKGATNKLHFKAHKNLMDQKVWRNSL